MRMGYSTASPTLKIAPGSTLPVRNLPSPVVGQEAEKEPPPYYMEWAISRQLKLLGPVSRWYADQARTVEEYSGESSETATGESQLTVIPDYEPASECITSVLITGPSLTPFTLQLGDRYMTLTTDVSGKVILSPVFFKLKPTSKRILTAGNPPNIVTPGVQDGNNAAIVAATAGSVSLPNATDSLEGFVFSLSTAGTAPMTITVSNVQGGPYTFTIPTGSTFLTENFPVPLRSTGVAPQVAWSATATAVGNVGIFGLTAPTSTPQTGVGSWMMQMSGYALARNEV